MAPWFGLVIMLGLAVFFYKAAEFEDLSMPMLWGGGSCLAYLGAVYGLEWGLCGALFLQLLLFVAMGGWIAFNKHRREPSALPLKARWRLRRGLCPGCGYDLRGTRRPGACPECGMQVPAEGG